MSVGKQSTGRYGEAEDEQTEVRYILNDAAVYVPIGAKRLRVIFESLRAEIKRLNGLVGMLREASRVANAAIRSLMPESGPMNRQCRKALDEIAALSGEEG